VEPEASVVEEAVDMSIGEAMETAEDYGPQLSFAGKSSELFIGTLGHLIYNPPASYRAELEEGGNVDLEKGAIVSFGLSLDAHVKFYFNERLDTRPRFFQVGLTWDELTGAYELEAEEFTHYILGMMLYMGYGVRL